MKAAPSILPEEFDALRVLFEAESGIRLGEGKAALVAGRLAAHRDAMRATGWNDYLRRIKVGSGHERQRFVDLLTTNETRWLREPRHFELLGELARAHRHVGRVRPRPFRVWSAACSTGEEPWSIAMVLAEHLGLGDWRVVATDLSIRVLERAARAVYPVARANALPAGWLERWGLAGRDANAGKFRIVPELRRRVSFHPLNLTVPLPDQEPFDQPFDAIFLRNVLIYFEMPVQRRVVTAALARLRTDGRLFIGHAESLSAMALPVHALEPTVYAPGVQP